MSNMKLSMTEAIARLMRNDSNATWDECETLDELRTGLTEALTGYDADEPTAIFYSDIIDRLEA